MAAETQCLRCGSAILTSAHLEHPLIFCVDHPAPHGRLRLGLHALLCQACGHVEFLVSDPSQMTPQRIPGSGAILQEEDF